MKLTTRITAVLLGAVSLVALPSFFAASESGAKMSPVENRYVGAKACKGCHSAAERGNQFAKWEGALHSKAFQSLGTDEAKRLGAERGSADPQTDPSCLKCHATAFGLPEDQIKKGFDPKAGVQCESCHGPGEVHMKARLKAMMDGDSGTYPEIPASEILTSPKQEVCLGCHNEKSPSFKPFCYHSFRSKIRHLNPMKPRVAGELEECGCDPCSCQHGCPEDGCAKPVK